MNIMGKLLIMMLLLMTSVRAWACPITADFNLSSSQIRLGDALLLTNTSSNAISYQWRVNGVLVSTDLNYTHTFLSEGTYTIMLTAVNTLCAPTTVSVSKQVVVTNSNVGSVRTGLPVFPLAVMGNTAARTLDWRYSNPLKDAIPNTFVNGGQTGAAFDECGKLVFFVLHTGSANANNLFIYRPDGSALLNNTVNAPGLNGIKGYQEIQVVPVPTVANEWYIIYKKWASDVGAQGNSGTYTPENWLYSRVRYAANALTVIARDIPLLVNGAAQLYTDGAAVSRTVPNVPNAHYLYLCRKATTTATTISIDRFIINSTGITFHQNSGNFTGITNFSLGISDAPIELSPTEDKLAVITRNQNANDIDIILLNTNTFSVATSQLLNMDKMLLVPDGGARDLSSIHSTMDTISRLGATKTGLLFLRNFGKKISGIEFSPNGKYLYFSGGGFVASSMLNLTYLGQIDLSSNTGANPNIYQIRLQIQTTPNNSYDATTGQGCNFASVCVNQSPQITTIESAYDGNLYFTKYNHSKLYVIPRPNEPLPQNLIPSEVDLSTPEEPNHDFPGTFIAAIPDQIDGFNYINNNINNLNAFFGKYNCRRECVSGGIWRLVEVGNPSNYIDFTTSNCFQVVELCLKKGINYNLIDRNTNITYNNVVMNDLLQYNAISVNGIRGFQVPLIGLCREICGNGIDDDGDGLVDCLDPDCCGNLDCNAITTSPCRPNSTSCNSPNCNSDSYACNRPNPIEMKQALRTNAYISEMANIVAGDIDGDGKSEMIGFTKNGRGYAYDIITGIQKYSYNIGVAATSALYDVYPAIGDVDGDRKAEVFIGHNNTIVSFDYNGTIRWTISPTNLTPYAQMGGLYDINGDGKVELIYGNLIINASSGAVLLDLGSNTTFGKINNTNAAGLIAVGDVLPSYYCEICSGLEIVAGNKVFAINITNLSGSTGNTYALISQIDGYTDGASSLADVDNDGFLDIVMTTEYTFSGYKGFVVWNPRTQSLISPFLPITNAANAILGRVTIMNIVGDTKPEYFLTYAIGTQLNLLALNSNFSTLWSKAMPNAIQANLATFGTTIYDLNNDEQYELIYRDNNKLYILNAHNGNELTSMPCASKGGLSYPIITNAYTHQDAEIICACRATTAIADDNAYINVFRSNVVNDGWKRARKVWNQHAYAHVYVNDNLTIPRMPSTGSNYSMINNFNVQHNNIPHGSTNTSIEIDFDSRSAFKLVVNIRFCNTGLAKTDIPTVISLAENIYPSALTAFVLDNVILKDGFGNNISILPGECRYLQLEFDTPMQTIGEYYLIYRDYTEDCCCVPSAKVVPSPPYIILPLRDILFTVQKSLDTKNTAILHWDFLAQNPQDYSAIQVERSNNAIDFEVLATNLNPSQYTYIDNKVNASTMYYRLLVTENNGETFYTHIKSVEFDNATNVISVFPNPFQNQVQVQIPNAMEGEEYHLELYDLLGRQLQYMRYTSSQGSQIINFNFDMVLPASNYILKVHNSQSNVNYFKLQKVE